MFRNVVCLLASAMLVALAGCGGGGTASGPAATGTKGGASDKKPALAYVTNGIDPFWTIAEHGTKAAAKDFNATVEVLMPPQGVGDQKQMVQSVLARGVDGIAISPIDPANQTDLLNEIAANTNLITHDSDAPNSKRLCFVGVDNYVAGRMCGQVVKEALPEGGKIMIFVGRIEQLNAKLRRQGVIDELMGRTPDSSRYDEPGKEIKGDKYIILDTRTDQFDYAKAKSLAEDAIVRYPDLACMVGLFAYNAPNCLAAVKEANKLGKIKIVSFDEQEKTLQGIVDGHIFGTVVQDPYQYGYQSVKILAALARGDKSVLPKEGQFIEVPAKKITKANVDEFWKKLKELTGPAK